MEEGREARTQQVLWMKGAVDAGGCTWKRVCSVRHAGSPPTPVSSLREIREGPERGMEKALEAGPGGELALLPGGSKPPQRGRGGEASKHRRHRDCPLPRPRLSGAGKRNRAGPG